MAASRALVIAVSGILLISFVLAATASAGGSRKLEANRSDTATALRKHGRRHAPAADRHDTKTDAPLDVMTSHPHHEAEHKRKAVVAKPPHPNKVHKQIPDRTMSRHVQKVDLPGSKKKKSKVSLRRIRRVLEKLMDEPVKISRKTETDSTPLEMMKSHRHALNVSILKATASKKERKHSHRQAKRGRMSQRSPKSEPDTTPLVMMKPYHQTTSTGKKVSVPKTPESKKQHKHPHRQAKVGRVQTVAPLADNSTLAKKPKPSHKKSLQVSAAREKKLARGKWRHVAFEERPLCKPHASEMSTMHPAPKHRSKTQRIVESYHNPPPSGRQDVFTPSGPGSSGPRQDLDDEAARLFDSFSGPSNSNRFPDNWAMNRTVVNAAPRNKAKRCADCAKDAGVALLTVVAGAEGDAKCAGTVCGGVKDARAKVRVGRSVGSAPHRENRTAERNEVNDVVTEEVEDDGLRHCIPTQTFAVGLICMSVVLSICFLMLWRKTDQPERVYALAYIVACIVYVILALVYLGTKSADYIQTAHAEE